LDARGGGQICRPFVLGLETGESCSISPQHEIGVTPTKSNQTQDNVIADRADDRCALAVMLCFYCTQTNLQSEFSREFFNAIFSRLPPLASAAQCDPHLRAPSLRHRASVLYYASSWSSWFQARIVAALKLAIIATVPSCCGEYGNKRTAVLACL